MRTRPVCRWRSCPAARCRNGRLPRICTVCSCPSMRSVTVRTARSWISLKRVVRRNPPWDRRFRIEHAQHLRPEDIQRFAALGVIASAQPYHAIDDGVWAESRIGAERLKTTYAFKSLLDAGVRVCFGSDWTVAPLHPLGGIHAAVTRRTLDGRNPGGWVPEQKLTVEEAVALLHDQQRVRIVRRARQGEHHARKTGGYGGAVGRYLHDPARTDRGCWRADDRGGREYRIQGRDLIGI